VKERNVVKQTNSGECDILFIEYTLESVAHYAAKIYQALRVEQEDVKAAVLHFDSVQKKGKPCKSIVVSGLPCFDIASFHTFDLTAILKQFSPRVVVMFNHSFLMDRAVIKACRKTSITTVFFQHGVQTARSQRREISVRALLDKIRRYSKFGRYYWYVERRAVLRLGFWKFLVKAPFWNVSQCPDVPSDETHCDYAFVWGAWYRDLYVRLNGYEPDHVRIIGCPDLDDAVLTQYSGEETSVPNSGKQAKGHHKKIVLYISQPFVGDGLLERSAYHDFLRGLVKTVQQAGAILYLGIHPRDTQSYTDIQQESDVKIVKEAARFIHCADVVLGHFSSLHGAAALLEKPIVVMDTFRGMRLPIIPGVSELATWTCTSMEEIETAIKKVVKEELSDEEVARVKERSRIAQQYFAINRKGVYRSFADILRKEFLKL